MGSFTKFYFWDFPHLACVVKGELREEIWCKYIRLFSGNIRRGNNCPVYPYVLVCMCRTPLGDLVLEQLVEDGTHRKKSLWKKTPLGVDLY